MDVITRTIHEPGCKTRIGLDVHSIHVANRPEERLDPCVYVQANCICFGITAWDHTDGSACRPFEINLYMKKNERTQDFLKALQCKIGATLIEWGFTPEDRGFGDGVIP